MVSDFPVPSRDVNNQTLPGREKMKLFLARESLVTDIPVEEGIIANLFFTVYVLIIIKIKSELVLSSSYFASC
jgi:hypothetical protein